MLEVGIQVWNFIAQLIFDEQLFCCSKKRTIPPVKEVKYSYQEEYKL